MSGKEKIDIDMQIVPIASLLADPRNARHHDEKNIEAITASLRKFGQQKPIVVDQTGKRVIAGNGTLVAAQRLGWENVAVSKSSLADLQADAYGIADNRSAELASWRDDVLASVLKDIAALEDHPDLFEATGFNLRDLDQLILSKEEAAKAEDEWNGMPDYDHEDKTAFRSIKINFKDQAGVDAFAKLVEQNVTDNTRSIWYPYQEIETLMDKRYSAEPAPAAAEAADK